MKRWLVIILIINFSWIQYSNAQTNSVKNRWNINISYSLYPIWKLSEPFITHDKDLNGNRLVRERRSNLRIYLNYGILNYLEIGSYLGFMHYDSYRIPEIPEDTIMIFFISPENVLAPTFGFNINLHLLPLLKKNIKSRWDVYIMAKYGGCYLINYNEKYFIPLSNINYHKDELYPYRHEYGIGIGGSVYFWNLVGLNMEFSFGQFSYWPRIFSKNFNLRGGIVFKFNTNQKRGELKTSL